MRSELVVSPSLPPPILQVAFPPLTYLQPTGRVQHIELGTNRFKVVEVAPHIA